MLSIKRAKLLKVLAKFLSIVSGNVCILVVMLVHQYKVSKGAKIRNRYNQVPHLTTLLQSRINTQTFFKLKSIVFCLKKNN